MKRLSEFRSIDVSGKSAVPYCILLFLILPNRLVLGYLIGQGSFGRVYTASWRSTSVAAKVIPCGTVAAKVIPCSGEVEILRYAIAN